MLGHTRMQHGFNDSTLLLFGTFTDHGVSMDRGDPCPQSGYTGLSLRAAVSLSILYVPGPYRSHHAFPDCLNQANLGALMMH